MEGRIEDAEAPRRFGVFDRGGGQRGDPTARRGRRHHRFVGGKRQRDFERRRIDAAATDFRFELRSRARARLVQYPGKVDQVAVGRRPGVDGPKRRRGDEHQPIAGHRPRDQRCPGAFPFDEADVRGTIGDGPRHMGGVGDHQFDCDVGKGAAEGDEADRESMCRDGEARFDAQGAADPSGEFGEPYLGPRRMGEDLSGFIEERRPEFGEHDAPSDPVEEHDAVTVFE